MAKLTRVLAKVFGSSAGANQIGQFGSLAASAPAYTTDPAVIQSLSNYLTGWFGAVVGSNSPAIEDMNALCYLYAYQIAYIMQAGVAEYDATTTYYINSFANSGGILYVSVADNNTGNALTDTTKWFTPTQQGMLSVQTLPGTVTLPSGKTMFWPALTIPTGKTLTVPNGAYLLSTDFIILQGTANLTVTGTGRVRII